MCKNLRSFSIKTVVSLLFDPWCMLYPSVLRHSTQVPHILLFTEYRIYYKVKVTAVQYM